MWPPADHGPDDTNDHITPSGAVQPMERPQWRGQREGGAQAWRAECQPRTVTFFHGF